MTLMASGDENRVPVIARLVQADEDTVQDVIHRSNQIGLACLDPNSLVAAPAGLLEAIPVCSSAGPDVFLDPGPRGLH